jgi:hypothetical protein
VRWKSQLDSACEDRRSSIDAQWRDGCEEGREEGTAEKQEKERRELKRRWLLQLVAAAVGSLSAASHIASLLDIHCFSASSICGRPGIPSERHTRSTSIHEQYGRQTNSIQ